VEQDLFIVGKGPACHGGFSGAMFPEFPQFLQGITVSVQQFDGFSRVQCFERNNAECFSVFSAVFGTIGAQMSRVVVQYGMYFVQIILKNNQPDLVHWKSTFDVFVDNWTIIVRVFDPNRANAMTHTFFIPK
jgi:hypothetical protein